MAGFHRRQRTVIGRQIVFGRVDPKFFSHDAFYALTAMSDRALAYSTEPLRRRHLVIFEAAGMSSDFATYLIRSLLSEGRLRYETVEKTKDGLVPRLIEREGPTDRNNDLAPSAQLRSSAKSSRIRQAKSLSPLLQRALESIRPGRPGQMARPQASR
jgi:hypothetical protein